MRKSEWLAARERWVEVNVEGAKGSSVPACGRVKRRVGRES